jgi:cytochrome oxidase Cu insertion factor (SCO1/SenC/PrrC family)
MILCVFHNFTKYWHIFLQTERSTLKILLPVKWPFLTLFLISIACTHRVSDLPKYDKVPPFTMTDSDGHSFNGSSLLGKVWVADFIYTSCPAACPMMSARMKRVHKESAGLPDVRIVSFSVDPKDTPADLKTFGSRYGGATPEWIFLTATPETVHQIAFSTFHTGDILGKIEHSTKFTLVDKQGYIRGYYSSLAAEGDNESEEHGIPQLLQDLQTLRKD